LIPEEEWRRAETLRPNLSLDEYIIMPNHRHGIIVLSEDVETFHETSLQRPKMHPQTKKMSDISPRAGSLGVIMRWAINSWSSDPGGEKRGWRSV
jgi:hypothetical protein